MKFLRNMLEFFANFWNDEPCTEEQKRHARHQELRRQGVPEHEIPDE